MFSVLLIESDPLAHTALWTVLDKLVADMPSGSSVASAHTMNDVSRHLCTDLAIDLVMCSGSVDERSSIEMLKSIRETRPEIFICLMSDGQRPAMHPADVFIAKPVAAEDLKLIIGLAFNRKMRFEAKRKRNGSS